MKNLAKILMTLGAVIMLSSFDATAAERSQRPSHAGGSRVAPTQNVGRTPDKKTEAVRPGNQRPQGQTPGTQPGNQRPQGQTPGTRPGNQRPQGQTPGMQPGNQRPQGPNPGMQRPGGTPPRPGATPPPGMSHHQPPRRPNLPPAWHMWRPTPPPPSFRPYAAWPRFTTVLGIPFGATIAVSLNTLMGLGYNVLSSYGDMVYVRNVPMLGYTWPEATLSYTSSGLLNGSEFINYSTWSNTSLYNSVYNQLCASYGAPFARNGMSATWWGPSGQYIRLNFSNAFGANGQPYFYTTLNFGIY